MIEHWPLLAPVVAGTYAVHGAIDGWRAWRRDEIDVTELLSALAVSGLLAGLGIAVAATPVLAGVLLGMAALSEAVPRLGKLRERRRIGPGQGRGG